MTTYAPTTLSVAIIGSGSAGAVAAYRLRELLGPDARIVVLERADRVGGRAHSIPFAGTRVEVGGTLIHSSNRRLGDLLTTVGLHQATPDLEVDGSEETLAVWDGSHFVFWSKTSTAPLAWALIRRYGLRNLLKLRSQTTRVKSGFTQVYEQQDRGQLYSTPREMLDALQLGDRTELSIEEQLVDEGIRGKLVGELVEGLLRNMYNQNVNINALAGSIALVGGGFAGGSLYSVGGGNSRLFERVLEHAAADLQLGREVVAIRPSTVDGRPLQAVVDADGRSERVDAVVVAAPLEHSAIDLSAFPSASGPHSRPYQTVHATLVAGALSRDYFDVPEMHVLPSHILTMAADNMPFNSIGVTGLSPEYNCRVYKIFSAEPVSDELIAQVFSTAHDVHRLVWQAYPKLDPGPEWPSFQLADRVFYVNAFESAVSTLETEAVAAWNVAGLVAERLAAAA